MKLYSLVLDSALSDPWGLRDHALGLTYQGERGPDGVIYPNISAAVPDATRAELAELLGYAIGGPVDLKLTFFRLSLADDRPPHWAHTDAIIAPYLALVYLTTPRDCRGGTAIVEHKSGMKTHPRDDAEVALWRRDTNTIAAWNVVSAIPMRFNRLAVLPTNIFHAALPHGFGASVKDGRLVLISFFGPKET